MASAASQLTQAYKTYLGRAPEAGIISWRLGEINKGVSLATQLKNIQTGPESQRYAASKKKTTPNAYVTATKQATTAVESLLAKQKAEQEGLFGQYETAVSGQEALPTLYGRLQTELGIPELQQQADIFKGEIYTVRDLLDRLDEDINARTQGTFTTEAQRRRQTAAEGEDLRNQLGRLGTGLEPVAERITGAQGELGNLLGLTVQQQAKELQPLELRIGALSDRFSREITGFTTAKQNELNAVLDKLERDRYLSDRDWQLAQQLAAEERAFARQKALTTAAIQANPAQYLSNPAGAVPTQTATSPNYSTWQGLSVSGGSALPQITIPSASVQGSNPLLQGTSPLLQGSSGLSLQGSTYRLQ